MAEQMPEIPEAWIGQEVTVYYGLSHQQWGTLASVSDNGIVVRSARGDFEEVAWYPHSSVTRLLHGRTY
jgi:hypothetical protein